MRGLLIAVLVFYAGCSKSIQYTEIDWKKGDSLKPLSPLTSLNFSNESSYVFDEQTVELREQQIQGIKIEDAFLKSIKSKSGEDLLIRASVAMDLSMLKKLKAEEFLESRELVLAQVATVFPALTGRSIELFEPLIVHQEKKYEILWVLVYSDFEGVSWELRIDKDLKMRGLRRVGSRFHDTVAVVFPRGPKKSILQEVVLKNLKSQPTLSSERLLVSSQAAEKISSVSGPLHFKPEDARFDQVQVFYFIENSLSWLEHKTGFKIPYQLQAEVHIGAPERTNSAFYYQGKIRIGSGDNEIYSRIPQDPSIVVHESMHAFIDSIARLPFEDEGGSLNEAFADFFTAVHLDNPNMGEAAYLKGPFRRTINNSSRLADRNGGLYHDSSIVSGTLWELRTRLGPEKGLKVAVSTLNRLMPGSDFSDFGSSLQQVLAETLTSKEDQEVALEVLEKRGWL